MDVHEAIETAILYAITEEIADSALLERVCRKAADAVYAMGAVYHEGEADEEFMIYATSLEANG